ncbi:hypothetical protein TPE_0237 [Treponema pedis str. T A4]|uniref:Uncharacterized protein n=1 Tax=Treponema pedis str. T A4 TaxID=1291379 RepID=S5ZXM1_9SPIR|nr:hypothetical protein TPE_0237 [Treponema pedis str. T A4]
MNRLGALPLRIPLYRSTSCTILTPSFVCRKLASGLFRRTSCSLPLRFGAKALTRFAAGG